MEFPTRSQIIESINKHKLLWLVFALGIAVRIVKFEQFSMFGHDSSRDVILTYKMFTLGEWIYRGPVFSVIWGNMSPIFYYLIAPSHFLLNFHPLSSSVFSNLVNFIVVVLASIISFKFFGRRAVLITALIFSVSILLITNASSALNPSFVPIFSIGLYYYLSRWIIDKEKKALIGISVCLAFMLSLHMAGWFAIPFVGLAYIIYKPKTDIKTLAISIGLFGLFFGLPFLIQEKKMAWWTVKLIIEYFQNSGERESLTFIERFTNFSMAIANNTSLFLFGKVGLIYSYLCIPIYLYLFINFLKSLLDFRKINYKSLLELFLGLYLVIFLLAVPIEEGAMNRQWFGAVFIPLFALYFAIIVSKLSYKTLFYIGYGVLAVYLASNIYYLYTFNGSSDSYFHRRQLAEFMRNDSNGEDFDVYGNNPEPIYYILWFYETDQKRREEFRSWFVWTKERGDSNLIYFIADDPKNASDAVEDYETREEVYTTSLGHKIIKFTK